MSRARRLSAEITLKPRDAAFAIAPDDPKFWHGGDPGPTLVFNALSLMFPLGERFFMDAVRAYRADIDDPRLRTQIAAFLRQEAIHTREHVRYNAALEAQGFHVAKLEARLGRRLAFARSLGPLHMLALTCALEHFTAILADRLLDDERVFAKAHPRYRRMWLWHAIEEAEHKGVAFDVFQNIIKGPRAYVVRSTAMLAATMMFVLFLHGHVRALIGDLPRSERGRARWGALRFLIWRPGFLAQTLPAYAAYYLPGFHPWRHDNRASLARVERELSLAEAA